MYGVDICNADLNHCLLRVTLNPNIQQMIRWMCGVSMKDRRTNEELRRLVGVEPITTVIRSGRLRLYGHVMRSDEDWVKKCMEFRVEGRRPIGRTRRT